MYSLNAAPWEGECLVNIAQIPKIELIGTGRANVDHHVGELPGEVHRGQGGFTPHPRKNRRCPEELSGRPHLAKDRDGLSALFCDDESYIARQGLDHAKGNCSLCFDR